MSIQAIRDMRNRYIEVHGSPPTEIKMGRAMLDAIADAAPWHQRKGLTPEEWTDHVRCEARAGRFRLFGIPVELCE